MPVDLVVKNGKVVTTEGTFEAGIAVDDGKIMAVAGEASLPKASKTIDAKGKPILPGAIDPHVHLGLYNQFGDDVRDSTGAQAVGGLTTTMHSIFDKRSYKEAIPELTGVSEKNAHIDMTFYSCIMTVQHVVELEQAFKLGVISFKHFTNRPEYEQLFGFFHPDDGQMLQSFEKIRDLGGVPMVHCEDFEIARVLAERLKASGRKDLAAWNDCRPDYIEHLKLMEASFIAKIANSPLYVVHNTVGTAREVYDWCQNNGVTLWLETTPPYLTHNKYDKKVGLLGKVNPPIRTKGHNELLWDGVMSGWIACIGTDHCPATRDRKVGQGDIWSALLGYPGSETMLPVMISEGYNKRGLPLERIAALTSTNTAKIHNIPRKGAIQPGNDADFVIVDLKKKQKIDEKILHYSKFRDYSLYEGWTFTGYPVMTFVRGAVVADDGEIVGKPGYGRVIKRSPKQGPKRKTLSSLIE